MSKVKVYQCKKCGNMLDVVIDGNVVPVCCGEEMTLLEANTTDAAGEKHVPVIEQDGNNVVVKVGSVPHPMTEEHLIQFVLLETENGVQRVNLTADNEPEAKFTLVDGDKVVAAYEFCNLHGLWKAEA